MDKEKIKKTLIGISVAGLIAGVTAMPIGCAKKTSSSCGKTTTDSKAKSDQSESSSSCGKGSCGSGSCSKGSCGK